jgi:hypothetical protein
MCKKYKTSLAITSLVHSVLSPSWITPSSWKSSRNPQLSFDLWLPLFYSFFRVYLLITFCLLLRYSLSEFFHFVNYFKVGYKGYPKCPCIYHTTWTKILVFLDLFSIFFSFLAVLEFELRALHLLGRRSYTWAKFASPFLCWIFLR